MAALERIAHQNSALTPTPKPGVDRKALRQQISDRYEHTLRRLGR